MPNSAVSPDSFGSRHASAFAEAAMRPWMMVVVMAELALCTPRVGGAQTAQLPAGVTRPTLADGDWRNSGAPLLFSGAYYYPTGPTVFFEPSLMIRSGSFEGVPIYVDATRDPYDVVYVPVAGRLMRPYERKRTDELAGTVGSVTPFSPPQVTSIPAIDAPQAPETRNKAKYVPAAIQSIPRPHTNRGISIEFGGRIWLAAGAGQPDPTGRLTVIGTRHGFPVYQNPTRPDEIYVPSVVGGPLGRFSLSTESLEAPRE
jgi:hypothetical protein